MTAIPVNKKEATTHPNSLSRDFAVQFLYQCECGKVSTFDEESYKSFLDNFQVPLDARQYAYDLIKGTFDNLPAIDKNLLEASENWAVHRMGATDRCVLRIAIYELTARADVPPRAVINEAIELARKYGSDKSHQFVNGILDKLLKSLRPKRQKT